VLFLAGQKFGSGKLRRANSWLVALSETDPLPCNEMSCWVCRCATLRFAARFVILLKRFRPLPAEIQEKLK
jgi:hypothetical protein